jgi:predicted MPP superfamily phosphohydrolase
MKSKLLLILVLSVFVFQTATSKELYFGICSKISIDADPIITRGPYLQVGTTDAITIRWRTDVATDSKITFGTIFGTYPLSAIDNAITTEHIIRIKSLLPDTKYFYTIGSSTIVLQSDQSNNFLTLPLANTTRKLKFLALGDCGNNSANQFNVKNATKSYIGANDIDAMILLGDNAYSYGTDSEYQTKFFDPYKDDLLKQYKLYPAPGNHDYGNTLSNTGNRTIPYYLSFTVPQAGEAGGLASGVPSYYSFDVGNVHFISLDSYGKEDANTTKMHDLDGAQAKWLLADLNLNSKKWTVVYFHHPPYTKTSHDSDKEQDLVIIREKFIKILEQNGVDLVLCGHAHGYERSYLLKGFYNNVTSPLNDSDFNPVLHTATQNNQNALYNNSPNSCEYSYDSGKYNHGTVYVVSGSAGQIGGSSAGYPQDCMFYSDTTNGGSFYFEVDDNRLDAKFISYNAVAPTVPVIRDQFTVFKDVNKTETIAIEQNIPLVLKASWVGSYNWVTNGNALTREMKIPNKSVGDFTYEVKDEYNCVKDVFKVTVSKPLTDKFIIYPNPTTGKITIEKNLNGTTSFTINNIEGKNVLIGQASELKEIDLGNLPAGVYYLNLKSQNTTLVTKIIKK